MYGFIKKLLKFVFLRVKFSKFVMFSFSVDIGRYATFEGMSKLYPNSSFNGKLGFGSYIGPRSKVHADIGRYTSIGPDVKVIEGTHPYTYPYVTTSPCFFSIAKQNGDTYTNFQLFDEQLKLGGDSNVPVKIGSDCWVGDRVLIIGGVTIADGAMILAGAVVTKDIPPFAIVGGVPAKILNYRYDKETIDFLLKFKWWDKDAVWLKHNAGLMNNMENLKDAVSQETH
jgi:acetyltransferase-like isoleucine patch superfamily enzyme